MSDTDTTAAERLREVLRRIGQITADTGMEYSPDHNVICGLAALAASEALRAENERLREALRAEIAKRHWKSNGERLTEADIEALEEQALAAVPEERE